MLTVKASLFSATLHCGQTAVQMLV